MTSPVDDRREWDLPHLKETIELTHLVPQDDGSKGNSVQHVYDVKFYPYTKPGVDPIFAVVGNKHIFICRPSPQKDKPTEIIQCIKDEEKDVINCSLAWVKTECGTPLLCVAGDSATIKIINALTGKLERILQGHGGYIQDFAVSPLNPEILASASQDTTIRIWSLNAAHKNQPLVALCAGNGHLDSILSLTFHSTGQYLLSAGEDHIVNLWTMPELPGKDSQPKNPILIHYPHFSTSEVHSNYVDCAAFYNDLILSKALNENCIVLWSITGFHSSNPPPPPSSAPTIHENQRATRSAFYPQSPLSKSSTQYTRLLQFDLPGCHQFYMRFSLYSPLYYPTSEEQEQSPFPPPHPVLAICNSASRVFFWDLDRLEEYQAYAAAVRVHNETVTAFNASPTLGNGNKKPTPDIPTPPPRPHWLTPFRSRKSAKDNLGRLIDEDIAATSSASSHITESGEIIVLEAGWERKYSMRDLRHPVGNAKATRERAKGLKGKGKGGKGQVDELMGVEHHRTETIPRFTVQGRQVAWSVGGEWCVIVGSPNVVAVFRRWDDVGQGRGKYHRD